MPIVTKKMSSDMSRGKWRPTCYKCGKFIGVGGYYDVVYDNYNGGYEEGYSTCQKHTDGDFPASVGPNLSPRAKDKNPRQGATGVEHNSRHRRETRSRASGEEVMQ